MNENRPISTELQQNFHILPPLTQKSTEPIFTIFTRCRATNGICKTVVHFVSEHESKER